MHGFCLILYSTVRLATPGKKVKQNVQSSICIHQYKGIAIILQIFCRCKYNSFSLLFCKFPHVGQHVTDICCLVARPCALFTWSGWPDGSGLEVLIFNYLSHLRPAFCVSIINLFLERSKDNLVIVLKLDECASNDFKQACTVPE
jgi:hypothetical protein